MVYVIKKEKRKAWISYIKNRIRKNQNFLCIFTGPTGSSKSWSALSVAEQLDNSFNIDRCIFYARDLLKLVNDKKLKKGSVVVWDEVSIDAGNRDWQSAVNKLINNLFTTFRRNNLIILFTSPYGDFCDSNLRKLFHAEFKTAGINYKKKYARIKPEHIQYNPRLTKYYHKRLQLLDPKTKMLSKISFWRINKPSEELTKLYEDKRTKFQNKYNKGLEDELKNIEAKAKAKSKQQLHNHICRKCSYNWSSLKERPIKCPKCQTKEWYIEQY